MPTMNPPQVSIAATKVRFEERAAVKRLGLIALATDLTSERDFTRLVPADRAAVHVARLAFENPTTPENLVKMSPRLIAAADLILPDEALAAVCYSCTAASVVIGDDAIADAIHAVRPGVPVVTPTGAARLALAALGINRIAILTPYLIETSRPMADYFTAQGFEVSRLDCFGLQDDRQMARVHHDSIVEAASAIDSPEADGIFISCTALPALGAVAEIEARTGKPVVTSNQASIWAMLRHAGLDDAPAGFGRLFDHDLPLHGLGAVA